MASLPQELLPKWLLVSERLLSLDFSGLNAKSSRKPIFLLRNMSYKSVRVDKELRTKYKILEVVEIFPAPRGRQMSLLPPPSSEDSDQLI